MKWGFIKRLFNSEPEVDLTKTLNPAVGQADLAMFEREAENRMVDTFNGGLNYLFGVEYSIDSYVEDVKMLIKKYREMSLAPDISDAIDEIVNECIIKTEDEIVSISLEDSELSDSIKETVIDEFRHILKIMDFDYKADEYFRQWYVDGRLYTQNLYNVENRKEGIVSFNVLSPYNLERFKTKEGKQYYIYKVDRTNQQNNLFSNYYHFNKDGFIIPEDHINFTSSGLKDINERYFISHLHRAIIPYNQLKLLEDGAVIYTLTRSVERRHFIVKTGKLNQAKAEAQVKKAMDSFKNRVVYDRSTGETVQRKDVMTITEDFWSAASDDGRGIDITPISAGTQLADLVVNMEYYKRNLLLSLKVPYGRFNMQGATTINFGDNAKEISRDELRFSKFTNALKDKFARGLFIPMLKKHLHLKGILDVDDFENISQDIKFIWAKDQYFEEIAIQERLRSKIEILGSVDSYIGKDKYFSKGYVYREVLGMTEEEINEMKKEINNEEINGDSSEEGMEDEFGGVPSDGQIPMDNEELEEPEPEPETELEEPEEEAKSNII